YPAPGGDTLSLCRELGLDGLGMTDGLVECLSRLVDPQREVARPLIRGRNIIVIVAEIGAFARRLQFDDQGLHSLARGDNGLAVDFLGMTQTFLDRVGLEAPGTEDGAPVSRGRRAGFACHRTCQVCASLLNPQL